MKDEKSMAYNLDQGVLEKFAIKCLSEVHDSYSELIWNQKDDNFDYVSNNDKGLALEITSVIPESIKRLTQYEKAFEKHGEADQTRLPGAKFNSDGTVKCSQETFWGEIPVKIIERLEEKNHKAKCRIEKGQAFERYELCICIYQCPFYDDADSVSFLMDYCENHDIVFDKVYIISIDCVFEIDVHEGELMVYNR